MKKFFIAFVLFAFMISCKQEVKQTKTDQQEQIKPITDEILESAVIYEANIRQYSPEGSFNAFTKDIPKL